MTIPFNIQGCSMTVIIIFYLPTRKLKKVLLKYHRQKKLHTVKKKIHHLHL